MRCPRVRVGPADILTEMRPCRMPAGPYLPTARSGAAFWGNEKGNGKGKATVSETNPIGFDVAMTGGKVAVPGAFKRSARRSCQPRRGPHPHARRAGVR